MNGPCIVTAEFYSPNGGRGLHGLLDELGEANGYELRRTGDRALDAVDPATALGVAEDARDARQRAIDEALSWMRDSEYVGGPSERDAWRKALEVLGPFETQHVEQGVDPLGEKHELTPSDEIGER